MAVTVDFYSILEIPRDSNEGTVNSALKAQRHRWRKVANSSDLSTRQEAQTRMNQLQEAGDTLLSPQRRVQYDHELQTSGVALQQSPQPSGAGVDWIARARQELGRGDYHSAAYSAREATHSVGDSAESWGLRSRANAGLGNLQDALYEARQAATIESNNPEYHFQLGLIFEKMEQYQDAIDAYQVASQLDPAAPQYVVAVATVMFDIGRLDDSLDFMRQRLEQFQGVHLIHDYYATLLALKAESIPRRRWSDKYMITSTSEIDQMRPLIAEAIQHNADPAMAEELTRISEFLDRSQEVVFSVPGDGFGPKLLILASPIICIFVFGLLHLLAIGILLAIAACVGIYFLCRVPRYRANARGGLSDGYVKRCLSL